MRRIAMQLHKNNDVDIGQSKVSIFIHNSNSWKIERAVN